MSAADKLLVLLAEGTRNIADRMAAAGFTEEEVRGAWHYASRAGFTEARGWVPTGSLRLDGLALGV